ncbi:hypothetical protein [Streptomyces albireticuli]|uniref:hypothetical protein n=1 Tax=Streptomyces albireticuli TaxID=1940 RepID=UPI001E5DFB05|nr:hypothetical protein [Streptomyces albireticuli]MCD9143557.1 hypothetical protein [Streptomyces albireticuli]MCD9164916.1 hypothetical protein [Streptomyces albireticuli]MCD9191674.1 hypothetical protein [Streptomyces albireticuli]
MSRRVSLPGADELFRTTGGTGLQPSSPRRQANPEAGPRVPGPAGESGSGPETGGAGQEGAAGPGGRGPAATDRDPAAERRTAAQGAAGRDAAAPAPAQGRRRGRGANRRPSGRERHDEKITVYVSAEELMDLEHARLVLRGEHGLAVDRGRIVREAVAVVLADLESRGDASILVRRLRGR